MGGVLRGLPGGVLVGLLAGCAAAAPGGGPRPEGEKAAVPRVSAMVQPPSTPAPGGGPTAYPAGTAFATGTVSVSIGKGGVFTPAHVYLRPGTRTVITNRDARPHSFVGFGGATDAYGSIAPGESITKEWHHPGTWTFRDTLTPNGGVFTVTDVPG
ncbi:MAG TPA: hypothetical protein V6D00_07105 [Pantanalinema sp.]